MTRKSGGADDRRLPSKSDSLSHRQTLDVVELRFKIIRLTKAGARRCLSLGMPPDHLLARCQDLTAGFDFELVPDALDLALTACKQVIAEWQSEHTTSPDTNEGQIS